MGGIRNWQDAEALAVTWMRDHGCADAYPTGDGADGGIDVMSSRAVAQVKADMKPVGRPVVQALAGIAVLERRDALLFTLAGLTPQADEWADRADVVHLTFDLTGGISPANAPARRWLDDRLRDAKDPEEAARERREIDEQWARAESELAAAMPPGGSTHLTAQWRHEDRRIPCLATLIVVSAPPTMMLSIPADADERVLALVKAFPKGSLEGWGSRVMHFQWDYAKYPYVTARQVISDLRRALAMLGISERSMVRTK